MGNYTQEGRPLKVTTPLGEDVLLLERFSGAEGMSRLFHYELTMVSESASLDLNALLRKPATISIRLPDDSFRHINGWVKSARQLERDMGLTTYRMEMVPWLWFCGQTWDCRIFQNKTVQQIIEKTFSDRGYSDYQFRLYKSYEPKKYLVEYRESDLNFVCRLMEEEGMFYYFEQSDSKHTLVITDSKAGYKVCPNLAKARFAFQPQGAMEEDFVHTLDYEQCYHTGKVSLQDFDFIKPSTNLMVNVSGKHAVSEMYDYPGRYYETGRGNTLSNVRLEEQESRNENASGISSCRALQAGYKFELTDHYRGSLNQNWLVLAVNHFTAGNNYRSDLEEPFEYTNNFEVIPASAQFRPPRVALKPRIYGSQTAIVTGPPGEEIYCDKYGRVKIHFHWDRENPYDDTSSCWVRVASFWAGKAWGHITIPRIGQEVLVDHMEGDPDRPLITGRVYNEEQQVPYKLPDKKTVSTWLSRSSKGGSPTTFNEIRMEDLKGSEQMFIHAQKDRDDRTKEEKREYVGKNSHLIVKENHKIKVESNRHTEVKSNEITKVGGKLNLNVATEQQNKVGTKYALDAGMEVHIKAGMKVVIEAGADLTVKGPGGFININPAGIFINGTMVFINSGGAAGAGSGCTVDTPETPDTADDQTKFTKL